MSGGQDPTSGGTPPRRTRHGTIALAVVAGVVLVVAAVGIWRGADTDDLALPDERPVVVPGALALRANASDPNGALSFQVNMTGHAHFKVTPLWDGYNNCILDNPFPSSYEGELDNTWTTLYAYKNSSGSCATEKSRMHWKVETTDTQWPVLEEEVRVTSGFSGAVTECIDVKGRAEWDVGCTDETSTSFARVNVTGR
jgi:hypothetical protein